MGNNKVGVAELPVEGCDRHHDAGKPGDQELEQESDAEDHRRLELDLSAPHRAEPIEDLDAGRDRDSHCRKHKKAVGVGIHPDREHVMRPDAQTDEPNADRCGYHDGVSKDRFARKYWNDLGCKGEGRNNQNVDFRMPEDPEEVHPKGCRASGLRIEEVPAKVTVDRKHDLSCGKRRYGQDNHPGHDQVQPSQQRHPAELHPGTSHTENGCNDVDRRGDAAEPRDQQRNRPIIRAVTD